MNSHSFALAEQNELTDCRKALNKSVGIHNALRFIYVIAFLLCDRYQSSTQWHRNRHRNDFFSTTDMVQSHIQFMYFGHCVQRGIVSDKTAVQESSECTEIWRSCTTRSSCLPNQLLMWWWWRRSTIFYRKKYFWYSGCYARTRHFYLRSGVTMPRMSLADV